MHGKKNKQPNKHMESKKYQRLEPGKVTTWEDFVRFFGGQHLVAVVKLSPGNK